MKYTLIGLFFLLFAATAVAQDGTVHIDEESSIRQLMDHRKALNFESKRKIKAWSVQVFMSHDKYEAVKKTEQVKNQFKHLNESIDWFYSDPYYRLYTGCFYTKIEAASLLHQISESYPNAIIFKNSEVKPSDLR